MAEGGVQKEPQTERTLNQLYGELMSLGYEGSYNRTTPKTSPFSAFHDSQSGQCDLLEADEAWATGLLGFG
ncbi:hypothetical protein J5274_23060 [Rhizobium sp. L51/94]|nr:hypothetical protein J5274_23060 [Rhizobium sp. L51/94]